MSRKRSVEDRPVPSIIEEIVIYDKPNKPSVPQEIFPQPSNFTLGKGDIVLSLAKDKVSPSPSSQKAKDTDLEKPKISKDRRIKNEPAEVEEIFEYEIDDKGGPSRINIKTEHFSTNLKEYECLDEDSSELEESIENISKEISRSSVSKSSKIIVEKQPIKVIKKSLKSSEDAAETQKVISKSKVDAKKSKKTKETGETTKKPLKTTSKDDTASPFKKPRGRAKKLNPTPQKSTLLNFLTKQPKSQLVRSEENTEANTGEKNNENPEVTEASPENNLTGEGRQKRIRRRPKKYDDEDTILGQTSLGHYTDENGSFSTPIKKKKYAELTIVPLYDKDVPTETTQNISTDSLEELLDEANEQVEALSKAEIQLESLVKEPPEKSTKVKKSTEKNAKKAPAKKSKKIEQQKITDMIGNKIKTEVEEESDNLMDVSHEEGEEAYGPDEDDSRTEWVPEEYAKYKQQHIMKLISKMHKCKFCGSEFSSYYSLRKHRALEHDDVGKDRKESTFGESAAVTEEIQEIDGESDEESRGEWMPQDYAEYKIKHNMNKLKRSQWYKCKICCAVFSNYYKLSKHRVEHENKPDPYECKQCDAKFKDVDTFTAHIRVHQGKDPYKCKKCEKGFATKDELIAHIPIHILKKAPVPVKRFRCDLCGKEFSKLCDIERHTRVHTGEKPCECNICHKRFQQSHNLSKHLLTHLHVRPFQCEICNKKFGRIDVLNRHLLTHSMEKPFKCELCNKGFIRQVQLNNHLEKMHPDVDLNVIGLEDMVTDEVTVTPVV